MNTLIIYCSKYGTTEKVSRLIAEKLKADTITLVNLNISTPPDLIEYDCVMIGGSIYEGAIQKRIKQFCKEHLDELLQKELGLFICCLMKEKEKEQFERAFPKPLRMHAEATGLFGGELLFEKMSFFDKLLVKAVTNYKGSISQIDLSAIEVFVKHFERRKDYLWSRGNK